MEIECYQLLLDEGVAPRAFVTRSLGLLEASLRELALLALTDWSLVGLRRPDLVPIFARLQRPSWGHWNGLLQSLDRARRDIAAEGSASDKAALDGAETLCSVLELVGRRVSGEWRRRFVPLSAFTRASLARRLKTLGVLALPIALRNRVAHDAPREDAWWRDAGAVLRPVVEYLCDGSLELSVAPDAFASPWFIDRDGERHAFNGVAQGGAVRYVSFAGGLFETEEYGQDVLSAFKQLLGETDSMERNLRRLLSSCAPDELKGVFLGDAILGPPIGAGGWATVHVGTQLSTGRRVAVKILHDGMTEELRERFQQEAAYLSRFQHPHIVRVLDYDEGSWMAPKEWDLSGEAWFEELRKSALVKCFIMLEWIEGRGLDAHAGSGGASIEQRIEWFRQAASALAAVHEEGLIHRDVKPSNLMVDLGGQVKLMDFGIARSQSQSRTIQTLTGVALGTPAYMSPEQIASLEDEREQDVGPSTDLYSLCATFYEVLSGQACYEHDRRTSAWVRRQKSRGLPPQPLKNLVPSVPPEIHALIMGGLESEPSDRPASLRALARDIERVQKNEAIEYRRPDLLRRLELVHRRHRAISYLLGAVVLLVGSGVVFYVQSIRSEQSKTRLRLAESLVNEGRALHLSRRWSLAYARLNEAATELEELGSASPRTDMVQLQLAQEAPRPILAFRGHPAGVCAIAFLPGGRSFVSAGDESLRIWDLRTARLKRELSTAGLVRSIAIAAELGLAILGYDESGRVELRSLEDWRLLRTLPGPTKSVRALAVAGGGRRLIGGGYDNRLWAWDLASGRELWRSDPLPGAVEALVVNERSGEFFSVCGYGTEANEPAITRWSSEFQAVESWGTGYHGLCLALSEDGRLLAGGSLPARMATLWSTDGGRPLGVFNEHQGDVRRAFLIDDRRALTASSDKRVLLWDLETRTVLKAFADHPAMILAADYDPSQRCLVTGDGEGLVRVWCLDAREEVPCVIGEGRSFLGGGFSSDGLIAATGGSDGLLQVWDAALLKTLMTERLHQEAIWSVAFARETPSLLTAGGDNTLRYWDLASGREQVLRGHRGPVRDVDFLPGRRALSIAGDSTLRVWDLETGASIRTLEGHEGFLFAQAASADGRRIVSGGESGHVFFWDGRSGSRLASFDKQGWIRAAVFSADNRTALTGHGDAVVRVWDFEDRSLVGELKGHIDSVLGVATFPEDPGLALSATGSGEVKIWDLSRRRELFSFQPTGQEVYRFVAASRDGSRVLFGGRTLGPIGGIKRGTFRLWSLDRPRRMRSFEHKLPKTLASLKGDLGHAKSLAFLGRWYLFRGLGEWAYDLLTRARDAGASIASLELARSSWLAERPKRAAEHFREAKAAGEAPDYYLDLCLSALPK